MTSPHEGSGPIPGGERHLPFSGARESWRQADSAIKALIDNGRSADFARFRELFATLPAEAHEKILLELRSVATSAADAEVRIDAARMLGEETSGDCASLARLFRQSQDPEISVIGMDLTNRLVAEAGDPARGMAVIVRAWNELGERPEVQQALVFHISPRLDVVRALLCEDSASNRLIGALLAMRTPDVFIDDLLSRVLNGADTVAIQSRNFLIEYVTQTGAVLPHFFRSINSCDVVSKMGESIAWSEWCRSPPFIRQLCHAVESMIDERRWEILDGLIGVTENFSFRRLLGGKLPLEPRQSRKILIRLLESGDTNVVETVVSRLRTTPRYLRTAALWMQRSMYEESAITVTESLGTVTPLPKTTLVKIRMGARAPRVRDIAISALGL